MITLFTGNFETLVEFMFKFYDFDKNDLISIEDIRIVLSYIPLNEKRVQKMSIKDNQQFEYITDVQELLYNKLNTIFDKGQSIDKFNFTNTITY